ncbi:hypothetical protein T265_09581 [Opisthorchis viverrini]|uniref:Uncharacterized protein n=1 Tax=Opisthorchis viverrini TaxID=6198 RepID=A0A074ZGB1_OPIVI|nr:hypothetical protein T265_09581 [Opisthorchis viverrini]KER22295.1 hypothetical protein T265_09581 [Opisthorchis viverrini]
MQLPRRLGRIAALSHFPVRQPGTHTGIGDRKRSIIRPPRNVDEHQAIIKDSTMAGHAIDTGHRIDSENTRAIWQYPSPHMLPSSGMAARHRNGVTTGRFNCKVMFHKVQPSVTQEAPEVV